MVELAFKFHYERTLGNVSTWLPARSVNVARCIRLVDLTKEATDHATSAAHATVKMAIPALTFVKSPGIGSSVCRPEAPAARIPVAAARTQW